MNIIIRPETEKDYSQTEAMTRRSFWNKFGPGCNEHLLVHVLREHPSYLPEFSRVAEVDGQIAGTVMYFKTMLHTQDGDVTVPSFGPLCVDHRFKNLGLGGRLLRETLPLVKAAGWPGVLIFGEPGYYPKHGFVRAGSLGLTDMEGKAPDPFMALEFTPGSLVYPGARFDENAFGLEDALTDDALEKLEAEQHYEYLAKLLRPCQWGYENASDEKDGYHLEYAVMDPKAFDDMFPVYLEELCRYDKNLKSFDAGELLRDLRENVTKARYIIRVGKEAAGLLVVSAPETPEEAEADGCGSYLEEIWVRPEFRHRGIAGDIFRRHLRWQKTDTGFCVIEANPAAKYWLSLLKQEGYEYKLGPGDGFLFCRVKARPSEQEMTGK